MRLGETYMDEAKRQDILIKISNGRQQEQRVFGVVTSLPAWAERPFMEDQEKFVEALRSYQQADPVVKALESRLAGAPGPIWKDLTPDEQTALSTWSSSVNQLNAFVNTYFPSESQKYWARVALFVIGVGALMAPLFLSADENGPSLPFHIGPPALPPSMTEPSRRPAAAIPPGPTVLRPSGATPVRAEVFRPTSSPWRTPVVQAPPASPSVTPGYRSFVRALGPSTPVTPASVAAGGAPPPASAVPGHGPRVYPRFRSS